MDEREALSQKGAERLARKIQRIWKRRGYKVKVWAEKVFPHLDQDLNYQVRSNMVAGLPANHPRLAATL